MKIKQFVDKKRVVPQPRSPLASYTSGRAECRWRTLFGIRGRGAELQPDQPC